MNDRRPRAVAGRLWLLSFFILPSAFCLPALGQPFTFDWYSVEGGGGGTSAGGDFAVSGTIGQPEAGDMSGGSYSVAGGFWSAIALQPPVGTPDASPTVTPPSGEAPLPVQFTANATDPNGDPLTYAWDFGDASSGNNTSTLANPAHTYAQNGSYVAWLTVSDGTNTAAYWLTISVVDATPPTVTNLQAVPSPVATNAPVVLQALAVDPLASGSPIAGAAYTLDGANFLPMLPQDGTFNTCSEAVVADLGPFSSAGVYTIQVRAWDQQGNIGQSDSLFLPVYDPSAGFVTGGGWINSPPGAFHPALVEFADVSGKATFGFVSKYQKGANVPTGNTEFQFKAGNLNFKSTAYQWLVVAGARAQFKGWGTINGEGSYAFLLTAIDGQVTGGGGLDRFRIKIWDETSGVVVYDNQAGTAENAPLSDWTIIQGGSIVIHKP